jgi:hypothetical protein
VLRVRKRQRLGVEDIGVPEIPQRAEIAGEESKQAVGIPREDPRVQQRIAKIPGDVGGQTECERPGEEDGDGAVDSRRDQRVRNW